MIAKKHGKVSVVKVIPRFHLFKGFRWLGAQEWQRTRRRRPCRVKLSDPVDPVLLA